jgi:hypothetical protein
VRPTGSGRERHSGRQQPAHPDGDGAAGDRQRTRGQQHHPAVADEQDDSVLVLDGHARVPARR